MKILETNILKEINILMLFISEKICRLYIMPYVQLGLWPRLITRLITFSTSFLTKVNLYGFLNIIKLIYALVRIYEDFYNDISPHKNLYYIHKDISPH